MNIDHSARYVFVAGKNGSLICAALEELKKAIVDDDFGTIVLDALEQTGNKLKSEIENYNSESERHDFEVPNENMAL